VKLIAAGDSQRVFSTHKTRRLSSAAIMGIKNLIPAHSLSIRIGLARPLPPALILSGIFI